MNIRKKISFFALFLISSFFIMGEVKATTYYRYGETNGVALFSTNSKLASTEETNYKAYRFTFVNANGSIVEGTKPVDIWFSGNDKPWNKGGTYYKSYKFDQKQTQYDGISYKEVAISSCSNDECYMSGIINYYKNNTSQFRTKLVDGTGNSSFDEGEFLVVEKLYTINIKTATIKSISRGTACNSGNEKLAEELNIDCSRTNVDWSATVANEIEQVYNNYYSGTGLELLKKLSEVEAGKTAGKIDRKTLYYFGKWGDRNQGTGGLYFLKNNIILQSFASDLDLNSTVKGFTAINQSNTAPNFSTTSNLNTLNSNIQKALNREKGYGINIFARDDFIGCNSKADADALGLSWNVAARQCCAKDTYYKGITKTDASGKKIYEGLCCKSGQDYNPNTKKCETVEPECNGTNYTTLKRSFNSNLKRCCLSGQALNSKGGSKVVTSCFTKDSTTNNDYKYSCTTSSSMCNNNVNSTINSYTSGVYIQGANVSSLSNSSNNKNNESGQCILNNNAYYKGTVNGVKIYCSETLQTDLNNMLTVSTIRSGSFLPVNSPTVSVKHDCYYSPTSMKEAYINGIKALIENETAPTITLRFMDKDYIFNSSNKSNDAGTLNYGFETYYGENYVKYSFKTDYTYSTNLLNKFVDKRTAKGSNDSTAPINGAAYNGFVSNLNISIPTNASGKHDVKYTIGSYDDEIIGKILNNKSETIQKTYDTGKSVQCGGICTVSYNSNKLNCATKADEIKSIFRNGYGSDLQISNTSNSCEFSMKFPVGSQAECTRSKGNDLTLSTSYSVTNCTEKVKFETKVTGDKNSCSNYVTVSIPEEIIYRPIDLSNPFPGKNGTGRPAGSNWSESDITNYIKLRQDAYTKVPLYSITLTPTIIEEIRNYNQKNSYDDFTLTCAGGSEGSACYSNFIRKYLTENKSACYNKLNRNKEAFFSCADYTKR